MMAEYGMFYLLLFTTESSFPTFITKMWIHSHIVVLKVTKMLKHKTSKSRSYKTYLNLIRVIWYFPLAQKLYIRRHEETYLHHAQEWGRSMPLLIFLITGYLSSRCISATERFLNHQMLGKDNYSSQLSMQQSPGHVLISLYTHLSHTPSIGD